MIDIFVPGVSFIVWLAAFIGLHIAVWASEELRNRNETRRLKERYCEDRRRQSDSDEEDREPVFGYGAFRPTLRARI